MVLYQVSDKGHDLLRTLARRDKELVNSFAHKPESRELLRISWDGDSYWLESSSGYKRRSSVTEVEDVSYVSSAYIPQCLRFGGRPTLSNAHRAHESGETNIRDVNLDEIITLNSVSIIVAEYIPFGANQILTLNNNVGSTERVQGGYVSNVLDDDSSGTALEISNDMTRVEVLDYTQSSHINFEAEIRFREAPGVTQVETFGISLNAEGTCFYGMQLEAVQNRIKDNISLDNLSRVLVDVQQDSSSIVGSVLSQYQRDLLDLVFVGDSVNRNKLSLVIANEITPHLTSGEYMNSPEYQNEFSQIVGDVKAAYDISEQVSLVFGSQGLLVCGPTARNYEPLLCAYLQFQSLDLFLQNLFSRVWILNDDVRTSFSIVKSICHEPEALTKSRSRLCILSKEIIMLEQIMSYLEEALGMMGTPLEPPEQDGRSLFSRLELSGMKGQLVRRVKDAQQNLNASRQHLDLLREQIDIERRNKSAQMGLEMEKSSKQIIALQKTNGDVVRSLKILQVVFSGMLSFSLLDRITGDWSVVDTEWLAEFVDAVIKKNALVWFFISMGVWAIIAIMIARHTYILNWKSRGTTTVEVIVNRKISTSKLRELILQKEKTSEDRKYRDAVCIVTASYQEPATAEFGGTSPLVSLEYDDRNQILLKVTIDYNRREAKREHALSGEELRQKVFCELDSHCVFADDSGTRFPDLAAEKRRKTVLFKAAAGTDSIT